MNLQQPCPLVSVIVPAYNAADTIPALVCSLRAQDYPSQKIEILIVDNNSTDNTEKVIKDHGLSYLKQDIPQNSYASRNLGIENAKGQVMAFTDADCRADSRWIKEGVNCIRSHQVDIAVGNLVCETPGKSLSSLYSRSVFGNQKYLVEKMAAGATGNLFMRRSVVDKEGYFDQRVRYGADTLYTSRASSKGYRIAYCPEALVYHVSHPNIKELWKKWWRTGFGAAQKYCLYGTGEYAINNWRWYIPGWRQLKQFKNVEDLNAFETVQAFFIIWITKLAFLKGNRDGYNYCRNF